MRAIAFTRVSTAKQDEGVRQIQQIKKYCFDKGYQLIESKTISEIVSGVADNRAGLFELTQLTKADADIIIVSEASRLTRKSEDDFMDLYSIVKTIQNTGLDLFILGSSQTYTADKKLTLVDVITLVIEADRNSKDREQSKVRFRTGKEKKLAAGGYTGHTMPYGYYNNAKGLGKVIKPDYFSINEDEAKIVRTMFDLVANKGYSVNKTTIYLNNVLGLKCTEATTLKRIKSKVYTGTFLNMGKEIAVPTIVTLELFNKAQANINVNHLYINKGIKNLNPLKGIGKCSCGCSLFNRNNRGTLVYNCTSKARLMQTHCNNYGINAEFLNSIVWNTVKEHINIDDFAAKTDEQKQIINVEVKATNKRIVTLQADKAEITVKIDSLVDNIIDADKSIKPTLNNRLKALVATAAGIDKDILKAEYEAAKLNNKLNDLSISLLPEFINEVSEEGKQEIIAKYVDKVTYYSVDICKGYVIINFKNTMYFQFMTTNRPDKTAYTLPYIFRFNPETKMIVFHGGYGFPELKEYLKGFEPTTALNIDDMLMIYKNIERFKEFATKY